MKLGDAIPVIRQTVSAVQAAGALGLQPDRYGRCACPIHGGKDRNMKLFDGERGYYCFVCHSGGDVLDLVQNVNGCNLKDAAVWLDGAFGLGLNIGAAEKKERTDTARRKVAERKLRQAVEQDSVHNLNEARMDALGLEIAADAVIEANRPRRYSDTFTDAFCAGLRAREESRRAAEELAVMASAQWERTK